jgi:serine/threonine-protein kinase
MEALSAALPGRYRIERELGQGGMATVYLAHDIRHDRKVALKVLRPELAAVIGADRFLAEIRTTANLQHPHILPLFDSGVVAVNGQQSSADRRPSTVDLLFYVMPFIEGESLRDRLAREKQLPIDEAVAIASEVGDALDYAHRHGVIHRDIKPENILLHDRRALVADFGIALAASKAGDTRMTETGMSVGTPHYMSPEQAMGQREITPRSDVYALGCVTYEMLCGEPPFSGPTAQAIVAKVLTEEPRPLVPRRHTVPPHVEDAVLTALEKLPADRFATAAEFVAALTARRDGAESRSRRAARPPGRRWPVVAMGAVTLAALAVAGWAFAERAQPDATTWTQVVLSDSVEITNQGPALAVSPDGETIVFKDGRQDGLLWRKYASRLEPEPIPGTERGFSPVFSPDGKSLAFVADGHVKTIPLVGGNPATIADSAAPQQFGATWLDDNTIVYVGQSLDRLFRVNAAGGPVTTVLTQHGLGFLNPTALPHARGVLFLGCTSGCMTGSLRVLDLRTGQQKQLVDRAFSGWYLPWGALLYLQNDGTAMVAPFSLDKLAITGTAVPVLEQVMGTSLNPMLALSMSGTLAYMRGAGPSAGSDIVRVARDGVASVMDSSWRGQFNSIAIAPDGRRMAVDQGGAVGEASIWVKQLERGPFTRLTFGGRDRRPAWSPDGKMVAFVRDSGAGGNIFVRAADGSGREQLLVHLDRQVQEVTYSPDGKWIVLRTDNSSAGAADIVGVRTGGDTMPVPIAATPFSELSPSISPDSRWVAYMSNQSGVNQIYVRALDEHGGLQQVSTLGGSEPRWSPDGRELFYLDPRQQLMAATVRTSPAFEVAGLRRLFDASGFLDPQFHQSYDAFPDGRSFAFMKTHGAPLSTGSTVVVVRNWFADVRARLGR